MRTSVRRSLTAGATLLLAAGGLSACGAGGSASAGASASPDTIIIKNFGFSPSHLTVAANATITVRNMDSSTHTLTANDGAFDTGNIAPGHSATIKAPKAGAYPYHCAIHQFMTGTLTVSG